MDPRPGLYEHPYAGMVTAVFLFALLVTGLYVFNWIPGIRKTPSRTFDLLVITVVLLVATAASWVTALVMSSEAV